MNRYDAFERELTAWFIDMAAPRTPHYTTDIVQLTATVRQRPRWTFLERWLPMSVITLVPRSARPVPWRTITVVALLALILAAAAILYVGSQQRLPPPFGLAANGLVAYVQDGDIVTVDPATGSRTWLTSGNERDHAPRWSLDGTRLAFLREHWILQVGPTASEMVVVVDREANVLAKSRPIPGIDPDAVALAPDGRSIAVGANGSILLIDAADGTVAWLAIGYLGLDVYWRPGTGRELLLQGQTSEGIGLVVVPVDEPAAATLIAAAPNGIALRPNGWTADGRRVVYTRIDDAARTTNVHVLEVATGVEVEIDAAFAHVSNDGTRLVAIDPAGRPCVASIEGGPCIAIGEFGQIYTGMHAAGAHWAPDDESIMVRVPDGDAFRAMLLDPTGGTNEQPSWSAPDAESWQRLAP